MPITRTTYPERILIVLNPDGTMKGAHQEAIETIADGAEVLSVKQTAAAPLNSTTLAAVLPDHGSLLSQVQTLTDALATMTTDRDAALTAKAALEAQVAQAQPNPIDSNGFPVLSAVQVRLALLSEGITFAHVDAVIDSMPAGIERDTARTYWEYSVELHREHPMIAQFAAALGMTNEQVDTMWRGAA